MHRREFILGALAIPVAAALPPIPEVVIGIDGGGLDGLMGVHYGGYIMGPRYVFSEQINPAHNGVYKILGSGMKRLLSDPSEEPITITIDADVAQR